VRRQEKSQQGNRQSVWAPWLTWLGLPSSITSLPAPGDVPLSRLAVGCIQGGSTIVVAQGL
jgi:hypothetical protein